MGQLSGVSLYGGLDHGRGVRVAFGQDSIESLLTSCRFTSQEYPPHVRGMRPTWAGRGACATAGTRAASARPGAPISATPSLTCSPPVEPGIDDAVALAMPEVSTGAMLV